MYVYIYNMHKYKYMYIHIYYMYIYVYVYIYIYTYTQTLQIVLKMCFSLKSQASEGHAQEGFSSQGHSELIPRPQVGGNLHGRIDEALDGAMIGSKHINSWTMELEKPERQQNMQSTMSNLTQWNQNRCQHIYICGLYMQIYAYHIMIYVFK